MSKRPYTFLLRQKQFLKFSAFTYIEQETILCKRDLAASEERIQ